MNGQKMISPGLMINKATAEVSKVLMDICQKYGLSATLMDCIISSALNDFKDMKASEYAGEAFHYAGELEALKKEAEGDKGPEEGEKDGNSEI